MEKHIRLYEETAAVKNNGYIRGFEWAGQIYYYFTEFSSFAHRIRETRVSQRHGKDDDRCLRLYRHSISEKENALEKATVCCSLDFFKQVKATYHFNNGEAFEQVIRMFFELPDYKAGDRRGYWECGDIELNGKQFQVKFDDATLSAYKTIEKAAMIKGIEL